MVRPAAILFDMDGTLADSFEGIGRALNTALRETGLPSRDLQWVHGHVGRGMHELVVDAAGSGAAPAVVGEVESRCLAAYRLIFPEQTSPLPGAREVLSWCHAGTGDRVAVVSNKLSGLSQEWMRRFDLDRFVALIVGPDTYGVRKPDPGAVLPVLTRFGVAPADALMVGDMAVDAATGRAAGMPVVGIRQDGTDAADLRAAGMQAVLFDLRDLPAWLAGNGVGWATIGRS